MKNRYRLLAVVLAFGGFAAACSSEPATRADFIEELTSDGSITEAQANCAADGAEEAGLSWEIANQTVDEVSDEDTELLTGILFDCLLGS